nr:GTP pyrophosphokinase [Salmonella sp. NCTC 7297]
MAAHWKYKEGAASGGVRSGHEDRIAWLRKLIAWQEEMADSGEMLDEVRSQVFDDRVYVFTPKGDVVDLPAGSTPLDFAYHIHSDVGHRCIGAKIGGRIVPFTYQLQMGDQVENYHSEAAESQPRLAESKPGLCDDQSRALKNSRLVP